MLDDGIKIVNVGTPPKELGIDHENYKEKDLSGTTYSEMLAYFGNFQGMMIAADTSGGFWQHAHSDLDLFFISEESKEFTGGKAAEKRKNLESEKIKTFGYDEIKQSGLYTVISNHVRERKPQFASKKRIIFV